MKSILHLQVIFNGNSLIFTERKYGSTMMNSSARGRPGAYFCEIGINLNNLKELEIKFVHEEYPFFYPRNLSGIELNRIKTKILTVLTNTLTGKMNSYPVIFIIRDALKKQKSGVKQAFFRKENTISLIEYLKANPKVDRILCNSLELYNGVDSIDIDKKWTSPISEKIWGSQTLEQSKTSHDLLVELLTDITNENWLYISNDSHYRSDSNLNTLIILNFLESNFKLPTELHILNLDSLDYSEDSVNFLYKHKWLKEEKNLSLYSKERHTYVAVNSVLESVIRNLTPINSHDFYRDINTRNLITATLKSKYGRYIKD